LTRDRRGLEVRCRLTVRYQGLRDPVGRVLTRDALSNAFRKRIMSAVPDVSAAEFDPSLDDHSKGKTPALSTPCVP